MYVLVEHSKVLIVKSSFFLFTKNSSQVKVTWVKGYLYTGQIRLAGYVSHLSLALRQNQLFTQMDPIFPGFIKAAVSVFLVELQNKSAQNIWS